MGTKKKQKRLVFNKKNTEALADMIYSDHNGTVSFLKLCDGMLVDGKEGNRTMHCAVGEVYHNFVNHNMNKILEARMIDEDGDSVDYQSKYGIDSDGPTAAAIDQLVEVAQLRSDKHMKHLAILLDEMVRINDEDNSQDPSGTLVERSYNVAKILREEVAPLLK